MSSNFIAVNRGKRSAVIDLKTEEGRAALQELAAGADIVMHTIRPQKLAAIGLDEAMLRRRNPRLVYASLVGFDGAGPYSGRPAYDDILQGMAGNVDLMHRQVGTPHYFPAIVAVNDLLLHRGFPETGSYGRALVEGLAALLAGCLAAIFFDEPVQAWLTRLRQAARSRNPVTA